MNWKEIIGFRRKQGKETIDSIRMNELAYKFYWQTLTSIACSIYTWKGLPDSVNTVELEKTLLFNTKTLIFVDEVMGLLTLPFNSFVNYDVYGYPVIRVAYSKYINYRIARNRKNSVVVYDNVLRDSTMLVVDYYTNRLWNMDRTVDINVNAQKTPVLILGDEDNKLALKNAYQQFAGNMPVIFAYKNKFNPDSIRVLKTDAPFVAPELNELKQSVWNDYLTAIGVPNVNIQKKERLISDEVARGSGGSIACRFPRLNARREACKYINRELGDYTDGVVSCDFNEEFIETLRGGEFLNGEIHPDIERDSTGDDE